MVSRLAGVGLVAAVLLAPAGAATAKEFGPGDLRVCGATRCVPITRRSVLPLLGSFYYSSRPLRSVRAAPMGAKTYALRFRNGYTTGIVSTSKLDRFLSFGVNTGRFRARTWYRVPARVSAELRRLSGRLRPLRLDAGLVSQSV